MPCSGCSALQGVNPNFKKKWLKKMMQFTCPQGIHLGLEQYFLLDSPPHFLSVPNTSLSGTNGTSTTIPKFKAPLCTSILNVLLHT